MNEKDIHSTEDQLRAELAQYRKENEELCFFAQVNDSKRIEAEGREYLLRSKLDEMGWFMKLSLTEDDLKRFVRLSVMLRRYIIAMNTPLDEYRIELQKGVRPYVFEFNRLFAKYMGWAEDKNSLEWMIEENKFIEPIEGLK